MSTEFVELKNDTITFGKYKNKTLSDVLKDRSYCKWLIKQEWYKPLSYFIYDLDEEKEENNNFLHQYEFFRLKILDDVSLNLNLTETEKKCYEYGKVFAEKIKGD